LAVNYYREYGLPVKTVRPFNVYGPGLKLKTKGLFPDFFSDALREKKLLFSAMASTTRSFCYVSDAITGFMSVLLSHYDGEAFNVGNDELEVNIKTLADIIAELVGGVEIEFKKSS
jgi:UDP-glucuronate decarboxylase